VLDKNAMQAFVAVADHSGFRRRVREDAVPADVIGVYARGRFPRPTEGRSLSAHGMHPMGGVILGGSLRDPSAGSAWRGR